MIVSCGKKRSSYEHCGKKPLNSAIAHAWRVRHGVFVDPAARNWPALARTMPLGGPANSPAIQALPAAIFAAPAFGLSINQH